MSHSRPRTARDDARDHWQELQQCLGDRDYLENENARLQDRVDELELELEELTGAIARAGQQEREGHDQ